MQYYQIVKNKKAGFGLTDFFSILAFVLILLVFYAFLQIATGKATFEVLAESSNVADSISLINILRTEVNVDNTKMNIAELIALSQLNPTKKTILEQNLNQILDIYFSNKCSIICIDKEKFKAKGCTSLQFFDCNKNIISIPSYEGKVIEIAFKSDLEEPQLQSKPLK